MYVRCTQDVPTRKPRKPRELKYFLGLDVEQQVIPLPRADHPQEGLDLVPLDRLVEVAESVAQHLGHLRALLEQVERRQQVARQRPRPVIGLPRHRLARLQLRLQPEVATGQTRRQRQVGVAVHPHHPVLDPPRRRLGDRHPQTRRPVVRPPLEVDRRRPPGTKRR